VDDAARAARIRALLGADDRRWLRERLEPAWLRRRRRLEQRDRLIRAARGEFFAGLPTLAAAALAKALNGYAAAGWRWEKDAGLPAAASPRHRALHGILSANSGRALGARRIFDICGVFYAECASPGCMGVVRLGSDAVQTEAVARPGRNYNRADRQ
jgi:hypothetical protein